MVKKIAIVLTGTIILFNSCYNDKEELLYPGATCDGVSTSFATNVNPIIQSSCNKSGCHNTGSTNGPGALTNYDQIKAAAGHIKNAVVSGFMPQDATLTTAQIKTISCWVDAGAPNN
jgi:hypothetical protein